MVKIATIYQVKDGDFGPRLSFTLKKPDGTVWNLTDATVTCVISGGNTATRLSKACTVDSAALGTCHYDLTAADTLVAGKYYVECNIAYSTTSAYTTVTQGDLEILEKL